MDNKSVRIPYAGQKIKNILFFIVFLVVSPQAFSQFDPPDPDGDVLPGVPLDDHLHILLLIAGFLLAFITLKRRFGGGRENKKAASR